MWIIAKALFRRLSLGCYECGPSNCPQCNPRLGAYWSLARAAAGPAFSRVAPINVPPDAPGRRPKALARALKVEACTASSPWRAAAGHRDYFYRHALSGEDMSKPITVTIVGGGMITQDLLLPAVYSFSARAL